MKLRKTLGVVVLSGITASMLMMPAGENSDIQASTNAEVGENQAIYAEMLEINYPKDSTLILRAKFATLGEYEEYLKACRLMDYAAAIASPEYYTKDDMEIAAYQVLCANNLGLLDVSEELNNICVLSQVPTGLPDEIFAAAVGKLAGTIPSTCNPFEVYGPLAYQIHQITCNKAHVEDEFGVTCEDLKAQYAIIGPKPFEVEMDFQFGTDPIYQRIKKADINNPDASLSDYFYQLETLIILQEEPTDLYDSHLWYALFGLLDSTLEDGESLYPTFIEFAVKAHNLLYPDDILVLQEDGTYRSGSGLHQ